MHLLKTPIFVFLVVAVGHLPQLISGRSSAKQHAAQHFLSSPRSTDVHAWVAKQVPLAWEGLYRNIGNEGEFAKDTSYGAVVASPSTDRPNYFFQWVRDSALVYKTVLNDYIHGNFTLEPLLRAYVAESAKLQQTNNPSGSYHDTGLGEPKFHVDGSPFWEGWGRPQLDGPPLRAIVLIEFANQLLDNNDAAEAEYVRRNLYSPVLPYNTVIKADLEYTSHQWQSNGFDLWEEVNARHFFTLIVSRRALIAGAKLANRLGDPGAAEWYRDQARAIGGLLSQFWSYQKGFLETSLGANNGRSQLDCGTLLGSIHGNGAAGWAGMYGPESEEVLATLDHLVDVMKALYPLNNDGHEGVAIGRYPEDVYDGVGTSEANPWFICTFTSAEIVYNAIHTYRSKGKISIGWKALGWFRRFFPAVERGKTYAPGTAGWEEILSGMEGWADRQVARAARHAATNGSMSEQFSKYDGFMRGARDLTWSYASFLTTAWAKEGEIAF